MMSLELIGAKDLQNDLKKYGKDGEKAISKAVDDTALAIENDAKNILREYLQSQGGFITNKSGAKAKATRGHGSGGLLGAIRKKTVKTMESIVVAAKHYAAYIEFGIGDFVFTSKSFTAEEKKWAEQYKGTKDVTGFKGVSYLGTATLNQEKKLIKRIEDNLNALNK